MKNFIKEYAVTIMLVMIIILSVFNIVCSVKLIKDKLNQGEISETVNYPGDKYILEYTFAA